MAGENTSQFRYRPLLSQMTIKRGLGKPGPGQRLAPLVPSTDIHGAYWVRDRQRIGHVDTRRAPGELVKRMNTSKGSFDSYLCVDHSIIKSVPFEAVDGLADQDVYQEEENASLEALNEVIFAHEKAVHDLLWASSEGDFQAIYGTDRVVKPTTKWDASGGTIREDVQSLRYKIYKASGYMPKIGGMTVELFENIISDVDNELGERIKYTDNRVMSAQRLAAYLDLDDIIIFENLKDDANPGQSNPAYDFMYTGDHMGLFHIDPRVSRNKDTLASTFTMSKPRKPFMGIVSRYNEDNESYEYKCSAYFDVKLVDSFCGGVLFDCLT